MTKSPLLVILCLVGTLGCNNTPPAQVEKIKPAPSKAIPVVSENKARQKPITPISVSSPTVLEVPKPPFTPVGEPPFTPTLTPVGATLAPSPESETDTRERPANVPSRPGIPPTEGSGVRIQPISNSPTPNILSPINAVSPSRR